MGRRAHFLKTVIKVIYMRKVFILKHGRREEEIWVYDGWVGNSLFWTFENIWSFLRRVIKIRVIS